MEGLLDDNAILTPDSFDIDLTGDSTEDVGIINQQDNTNNSDDKQGDDKQNNPEDNTTEHDDDTNIINQNAEGVGGKEDKNAEEQGNVKTKDGDGSSPNGFNAYSSFAKAMRGDSIVFQHLNEEQINAIKDADSFADAMEQEMQARLDTTSKRIYDALNSGVQPNAIRQYEAVLNQLDNLTDEQIEDEDDKGVKLRESLIYQDLLNRKYSPERAQREVKKSFDAGTDVQDAKDALEGNKQFFRDSYQGILDKAKEEQEERQKQIDLQVNELKKSMLDTEEPIKGVKLDKQTRQKAYDTMTRPAYKSKDGGYITEIQHYADENPIEFRRNLGIIYTLTNGFKDIDGILKGEVKKQVRSNLANLESKINNSRLGGGSLSFAEGDGSENNSFKMQGWDIDL